MKYLTLPVLISVLALSGCSSVPKTHSQAPSLKYAQKYVKDAKDYNARARKTNEDIDVEIQKLLDGTE